MGSAITAQDIDTYLRVEEHARQVYARFCVFYNGAIPQKYLSKLRAITSLGSINICKRGSGPMIEFYASEFSHGEENNEEVTLPIDVLFADFDLEGHARKMADEAVAHLEGVHASDAERRRQDDLRTLAALKEKYPNA